MPLSRTSDWNVLALLAVIVFASGCGDPNLQLAQESHDFGKVFQGDTVRESFEIYNVGNARLRIYDISTPCGCVAVSFDEIIAARDSGLVTLELNTNKLRGVSKSVATIKSNDPINPEQPVSLQGLVQPFAEHQPKLVDVEGLPGEVLVADVVVELVIETPLTLLSSKSKNGYFKVTNIREQGERELRIGLQIPLRTTAGTQLDSLILSFDTPDRKNRILKIPLRIRSLDTVTVVPDVIVFSSKHSELLKLDPTNEVMESFLIRSEKHAASLEICQIELRGGGSDSLETRLVSRVPNKEYEIQVLLTKVPGTKLERGTLLVGLKEDGGDLQIRECPILVVSERHSKLFRTRKGET